MNIADKIAKLERHARSAREIGSAAEAEAFQAKADELRKSLGNPFMGADPARSSYSFGAVTIKMRDAADVTYNLTTIMADFESAIRTFNEACNRRSRGDHEAR